MNKIAVFVIYYHRYDKNISKINELLKGKFSYIYHIVPFYDGNIDNVITVYESSYRFGSYIAQAYEQVKHNSFTHYYIIADDMIINPSLNELNLFNELGVDCECNYLPGYGSFSRDRRGWYRTIDAITWTTLHSGSEIYNVLPVKENAIKHFLSLGIDGSTIPWPIYWKSLLCKNMGNKKIFEILHSILKKIKSPFKPYELEYPMVGGYIDTCLLTARTMPKICQYVGALSAAGLFVEISLPTAIVLASDRVITEDKLKKRGVVWGSNVSLFESEYDNNLDTLLEFFPKDVFYYHPVKLSRWKSWMFDDLTQ